MWSGKWRVWALGGAAIAWSLAFGAPAHTAEPAAEPRTKALDEATNLSAEVLRLASEGKYDDAIPLAERALAIGERTLGAVHIASYIKNLAMLYQEKGDFAQAEALYLRAYNIIEQPSLRHHPLGPALLDNLGRLYTDTGDYAQAEALLLRSIAAGERALGREHPDVAESLNSLAELYIHKGDDTRAETLAQRALVIRALARGADHPEVAESLNTLARLYIERGDDVRAEPLARRALGILEKALGPDSPRVAPSLSHLGRLYEMKNDDTQAESLFLRALGIREKVLRPDHPAVGVSLGDLARLYARKNDPARAEPLLQRALAIMQKVLGPDHPDVAVTWSRMALVFAAQGRIVEAVNAAERATDIQDQNAAAQLSTGSEDQKRLYMVTRVRQTDHDISLHLQYAPTNAKAARLALTALLRSKGRVLETMTQDLAVFRRYLAPTEVDELASVYSQLATQLSRGPGKMPPEEYRASIMVLEKKRQKLEAEIGKRSASFRNAYFRVEKRPVTIEDTQAALPKNTALVELARYRPISFLSASPPNGGGDKPRYAAYVLRPSGEPAFADLGEAAPIEEAIETLRRALADPDLTKDPKPAARALDRLLMQPIRVLLGDTTWVFMSADGPAHLVPFAALVDENDHYLLDRYLFSYINTGRDLLRFTEPPVASRQAALVLANPAFDDSSAPPAPEATHRGVRSIDMVTQRLLPLRGTVEEARTIHTFFPETRVLIGADATEEALKAVHAPRFLHLATHGFFLPEQPVPETLLHGRHAEATTAERAALLQRENPLLRSGIALAGFNRRRSGADDGVLTALEAAGLDLFGTRLVVLSACETGVGQATSGEGVYGLRRALSMAGAETQVMSLWPVDTGRTRELMQGYYGQLKASVGRSEAMRNVQLAMLADPKTSHPNLWASFIVSGDWRVLGNDTVPPDLSVNPGPRGCACAFAGETSAPNPAVWLSIAIGWETIRRIRARAREIGRSGDRQTADGRRETGDGRRQRQEGLGAEV